MNLNIKGIKRISTDKKSTLLRHPDGHEIKIAHAALSPKMKDQLQKIPQHFDEGGMSSDDNLDNELAPYTNGNNIPTDAPQEPVPIEPTEKMAPIGVNPEAPFVSVSSPELPNDNTQNQSASKAPASLNYTQSYPQQSLAPQGPVNPANNPNDPYGYGAMAQTQLAGLNLQEKGIEGQSQAQQGLAHGIFNAAQEFQSELSNLNDVAAQKTSENTQNVNDTAADINNFQINPNHYVESMSSGQKVSTALGMILAGAGSGVLHQENPVMKFLNQQVDRDVAAQHAMLGKKETLLSAYQKQYGNIIDATNMTKATLLASYQGRLDQEAAKAGTPQAIAAAQIAKGQFEQQKGALVQQTGMRQAVMGSMDNNNLPALTKLRVLGMAQMATPKQVEDGTKEAGKLEELNTLRANVKNASDQLDKKFLAGALTPGDRDSFVNTYAGPLAKIAEGRFNLEESKQQMKAILPAPGDLQSTRQDKARNREGFFDALSSGVAPTLTLLNINKKQSSPIKQYAPQVAKNGK